MKTNFKWNLSKWQRLESVIHFILSQMSKEGFIFLNMIIKFGDISISMVKMEPMTLIQTESPCSF